MEACSPLLSIIYSLLAPTPYQFHYPSWRHNINRKITVIIARPLKYACSLQIDRKYAHVPGAPEIKIEPSSLVTPTIMFVLLNWPALRSSTGSPAEKRKTSIKQSIGLCSNFVFIITA